MEIRSRGALGLNVAPNLRYGYAHRDGRTGFQPPLVSASVGISAADRTVREWINENFLNPSLLRSRELLPGGPSGPISGPPPVPITPTPMPNLSGRWDVVYDWTFSRCVVPPGFCTKCTTPHSYSVSQSDRVLRGASVDSQAAEFIGSISGNSVRMTLTESFLGGGTRTFSLHGTVVGRRVTGTVSGGDDRCGICRIDGTFAIEIE